MVFLILTETYLARSLDTHYNFDKNVMNVNLTVLCLM